MIVSARMYASEEAARGAFAQLEGESFTKEGLLHIGPTPDAGEKLDAAHAAGLVSSRLVAVLRRGLARGRHVVAVTPMLGRGALADQILDAWGPVDAEEIPEHSTSTPDPFSELLGIPTLTESQKPFFGALTRHDFAPMSFFPLLTRNQRGKAKLANPRGKAKLANPHGKAKLSANQRGKAKLIDNPAPFSSFLGIPVLTKRRKR